MENQLAYRNSFIPTWFLGRSLPLFYILFQCRCTPGSLIDVIEDDRATQFGQLSPISSAMICAQFNSGKSSSLNLVNRIERSGGPDLTPGMGNIGAKPEIVRGALFLTAA